tara:strand:- start:3171 stop:4013 length:843 start_codon:yes stop_codon:yes gene_type:complete
MGAGMNIGVRGSKLAIDYAKKVEAHCFKSFQTNLVKIKTDGDIFENKSIQDIGGKGVFVSAIEQQLLDKKIDVAVHSFKDLPAVMDDRLEISAVLKRNDPRDCYIGTLFPHAKVGTGSPRRIAQLKENFNVEFEILPIRGNIDTRIKKLEQGKYDAIILAVAGLEALNLDHKIKKIFPFSKMLPCVGQGVIAIQTRKGSSHSDVAKLNNHWNTYYSVMAERAMLQEIDGDCHTAVGAISTLVGDCLNLKAINYNTGKQFESTSKLLEYKLLGEEVGKNIK